MNAEMELLLLLNQRNLREKKIFFSGKRPKCLETVMKEKVVKICELKVVSNDLLEGREICAGEVSAWL